MPITADLTAERFVLVREEPLPPVAAVVLEDRPDNRRMASHIASYDRPGHYLRISLLFDSPFWRSRVTGSWFMLDAFGGCCVYDEGGRHNGGEYGVLGWLLAGADALAQCNADNDTLVRRALESLPDDLYEEARVRLIEGKVHRWAGAVSGLPGGFPVRAARRTHRPDVAGARPVRGG